MTDLTDLQCLWFLQEEGDAYKRNGNLGLALKRYQALASVRLLPDPAETRPFKSMKTTSTISTRTLNAE